MVLNNKAQMFSVWFPQDFFFPEVTEKWEKYIKHSKLPYDNVTDFMNAQIQKITYPEIDIPSTNQQQGQYDIEYTAGKELEPLLSKDFTITFKLTESYYTYWIIFDQVKTYLEYDMKFRDKQKVFMDDINLSFLSDAGLSLVNFRYRYIIPKGLGSFELSYAAQLAQYKTFDWRLHYNRMDIDIEG